MLCYKSGQGICSFVDKTIKLFDGLPFSWELILVGNYMEDSDDETPDIVKNIASSRNNIKAVTLPKKGMMGWDARSGLNQAVGRYICLIDGDGQVSPEDIIRVYRKIKEERLDFVTTYRIKRFDGVIRIINSRCYNFLFRILFPNINVKDINSKPKIFVKEVYEKMYLTSDDWFLDAEIIIKAIRLQLKIGEVPIQFYKCDYRKSFIKFSTVFEFIKNMVREKL